MSASRTVPPGRSTRATSSSACRRPDAATMLWTAACDSTTSMLALASGSARMSAVSNVTFKTEEWLLSEVLADRGETVVLEPASMRRSVGARAKALQAELGLSPRRKRTVEKA